MKKPPNTRTFSIVLPLYNEQDVAEKVIKDLVLNCRNHKLNIKFILVNNGSTDNTARIIDRLRKNFNELETITINRNRGYGFGIRQGLKVCKTDYIGFMWGDGQIKPYDLVKVAKKLIDDPKLDICKAVRTVRYDGWQRRFISVLYNNLFSLLFLTKMKDINGTPKIFKRLSYNRLNPVSSDWFLDAELMIKAKSLNMSVKETPIVFQSRNKGSSNVSYLTVLEFIKNLLIYRIKNFQL